MTTPDANTILRRLGALRGKRQPHERNWRECFDYSMPALGNGLNGVVLDAASINAKQAELCDGTAGDGLRTLASHIMSGLTPANARWFSLDVGQESEEERRWLDNAGDLLWENIHLANFDAEGFEAQLDLCGAGWFVLYIDEDRERGGLTFEKWPLAQCFVTSTRADGVIDTVYREFKLSAEAALNTYGDQLSAKARKLAEDKPDAPVSFVQVVMPRRTHAVDAKLAKNLPFASLHIEVDACRTVREGGYHEFPCAVPRWMKLDSGYGIGPMSTALPDAKTLNELKRMELDNADIAIAGMWIAEDDGVLNPRTVKVGPRKIIVANSVDSMKPLQSGANFDIGFVSEERLQANIRKYLLADQLQPQDGPQMTATEVHVRVNLIRQLLGPIYGRLQAEYLRPMIERCFGLAFRAGVFGPPPQSLAGREFSVRYVSPLARAQRLEDVSAMDQFELALANQAAAGNTSAADVYDFDLANRERAELLGVPSKLVRATRDVTKLREQRAQQQADDQRQEVMQTGALSAAEAGGKRIAGAAA